VDAAYGGPAILIDAYVDRLRALAVADSVALDPHKWLFVPVEAGLVFVRDAEAMRSAFSLVPPYLRTDGSLTGVGGPIWFSEFGFQQTRGFRALKVWMAMKEFGLAGYKAAIEANVALAAYLADCVRASPELELTAPPGLSVVCFRVAGQNNEDECAIAAVNRTVLDRLQLGGEAFLSGTELRGRFALRACIVNYRSTRQDIDRMLSAVRAIGRELADRSRRALRLRLLAPPGVSRRHGVGSDPRPLIRHRQPGCSRHSSGATCACLRTPGPGQALQLSLGGKRAKKRQGRTTGAWPADCFLIGRHGRRNPNFPAPFPGQ
jgi:hypothetical protein